MNRITLTLATVLSLAFTQVTAQDFNKGLEAYVTNDFATAFKEWKPLADQGDASAQGRLGIMYQKGHGVLKDAVEALYWLRLSSEQGDATGQYALGSMYFTGSGVPKERSEVLKWFRLSAEQGNAAAQFGLGNMYVFGDNAMVTAHMWYNISSANGFIKAGELRDKREALMTSEEISIATTMARECMNSNYKKCGY
jgi:TPR repeat protein